MTSVWTDRVDAARLERLRESSWVPTQDREEIPVTAPYTGETVGWVPAATAADVDDALARARRGADAWAERPVEERAAVLENVQAAVLDRRDELLDLVCIEAGKARVHAIEEVFDVAENARYYAAEGPAMLATKRRRSVAPLLTRTREYRDPRGVVGLITPWNYPLTLVVSDALPALLAGNAVVCKPAEATPFTALVAAELLHAAGVPADCFQVLPGRGPEVGPPLVEGADFVGFTGSTETGRVIARQAGESLTPVSLELGGKNPMLVLDDADVDAAAAGAITGCFTNAGQLCVSFERVYVHESRFEAFLDAFVERTEALTLGADHGFDVEVGSLLSAEQLETVEAHVADARDAGATVHTGGEARPDVGPYVYEPTVLTDVPADALVACEETFGPVVAVFPVADDDEAVARANDSDHGLNASVWTTDADRGWAVAERVDCGTVGVNDPYPAAWASVDAPMGGMNDSGIGRRHARQGLLKYTEAKNVTHQRGPALSPPSGAAAEWYLTGLAAVSKLKRRFPW